MILIIVLHYKCMLHKCMKAGRVIHERAFCANVINKFDICAGICQEMMIENLILFF